MAIAGAGGWTPSNLAHLRNGDVVFVAITQNKPPHIITPVTKAAVLLRRGHYVNIDVRWAYTTELRRAIAVCERWHAAKSRTSASIRAKQRRARRRADSAGTMGAATGISVPTVSITI